MLCPQIPSHTPHSGRLRAFVPPPGLSSVDSPAPWTGPVSDRACWLKTIVHTAGLAPTQDMILPQTPRHTRSHAHHRASIESSCLSCLPQVFASLQPGTVDRPSKRQSLLAKNNRSHRGLSTLSPTRPYNPLSGREAKDKKQQIKKKKERKKERKKLNESHSSCSAGKPSK
ncbi:hypothetical protein P170DRAFT_266651 [Aspergillus steynii IBT 23096]|uniref:Uncharacterized protein n=1 Tax=Aspergillus steynii IBT 23096 TaxID=1392250 RepID=A0A2I2FVX2_9EURO|nr:uncharacterized protein P170DRAFT_266651 [Aspergillus steynii IBT 23096]PLB44765.1 hypothetical protein P170DRAFT_266651 [Aspergillus steynii IBT 23096]